MKNLNHAHSNINNNLKLTINNLSSLDLGQKLNETNINNIKLILNENKNLVKEKLKFYESDKKRFKLLKQYSDLLVRIEKVLGLIPSDLNHLSLEELLENLENLTKTRNKVNNHANFLLYQNIFSSALNNVLTLEKEFQAGNITEGEMYSSIKDIKKQVFSKTEDLPPILQPVKDDLSILFSLYENNLEKDKEISTCVKLKNYNLSKQHKAKLQNLNSNTSELLAKVDNLHLNLKEFEPQADLTNLALNLKDINTFIKTDNFNCDQFSLKIINLTTATNVVENEQLSKNDTTYMLSNDIKTLNSDAKNISSTAMEESVEESNKITKNHSKQLSSSAENFKDLVNEGNSPISLGSHFIQTIQTLLQVDKDFCKSLAKNPNAKKIMEALEANSLAEDTIIYLQEFLNNLEFERSLTFVVDENDDDIK